MSLQRQHFLLNYLKTLNVRPAGVSTRDLPLGGPALSQLSYKGLIKGILPLQAFMTVSLISAGIHPDKILDWS